MKVLSLFDGISCGYEALLRAWVPVDEYYASEIDKHAIKVAMKNHPDIIQIGDVCEVRGEDYNDIDLIIGGSPCQWFSMAGKMLNFSDPRSKLFFEFVRLVKEVKPKWFLLENVKMKKEYIEVINENLWGITPTEINSNLVSAQNRVRLYWVGKLQEDGTYAKVEIPQPEDEWILLKDILLDYVEPKYELSDSQKKNYERDFGSKWKILEDIEWKCPTLTASMWAGGWNVPAILENYILSDRQIDMISKWGWYEDPLAHIKWPEDKMGTLTTHCGKMSNGIKLVDTPKIRKLHPIECERLQTLPDNYTEWVSDSQRYIQLGNGWTVSVIAHIFRNLFW